ncbi:MAG: S8 family peptidase [Sulfurimicrobium sp.]|nr:S8 family peptidase [Sulfurimicrobium sp.]MDP1705395.1 S8 family peptidase [Sulfurimicrobium sp.]MDP2199316.1 S8 family peptidase [Sulfurimicrobium sp.]MDP3688906.1 S8 family peptidase [Sulfurimicrobium sp.]
MTAPYHEGALSRISITILGMLVVSQVSAAPIEPMGVTYPGTTNQLIIKLKSQKGAVAVPHEVTNRLISNSGQAMSHKRAMSNEAHVFRLPKAASIEDIKRIARQLKAMDPDIELVEPDYLQQATLVPNDTYYSLQWHYFDPVGGINLPTAWDKATGSASIVVAVVDTGYRPHADLATKMLPGYDFVSDAWMGNDGNGRDSDAMDPGDWAAANECYTGSPAYNSSWHGTHVAGTIGAATNNGSGVAGVNWQSKILPVRVLGKCGGYTSDIVDGMRWAAGLAVSGVPANATPAKVINLSLGGAHSCSTTEQSAIDAITAAGTVVVVAAGNSNTNASGFSPASCNNVISVAAINQQGKRAYYSNYGSIVKIAAPGGDYTVDSMILSTLNSGTTVPGADTYAYYQGTSMAAPHVSGAAALLLASNATLSPGQVLATIQGSARAFPAGSTCTTALCGAGILDAGKAVNTPISSDTTPDSFIFASQSNVTFNTLVTSNAIKISGINAPAPISISSCTSSQCEYNINNSTIWNAFGSNSTVNSGDTVIVRQKSSDKRNTTTTLTLGIGGISASFKVTTGRR